MGRVLVAIDSPTLVKKLFAHIDSNDPQFAEKIIQSPDMVDLCSGRIGLEAFYRRMSERYPNDLTYGDFERLWCSMFDTMDGAEELVTELEQAGRLKLGLLSDTDPVHWNYIRNRWRWLEVIERPTLSFEVGLTKPAPAIYHRAAANVNTPVEKCLFIDDLAANVEGARAVGMNAVQFESIEQVRDVLKQYGLL